MYNNDRISLSKKGKVICPSCGRKTFVDYIYSDGTPVASGECGKCDRADNCGVHIPPKQWFADNRPLTGYDRRKNNSQPQRRIEEPKPSFIDKAVMFESIGHYDLNPLAIFLHRVFDGCAGADVVDSILQRYAVGTSSKWGGATVYWQVDSLGNIRTAKVMGYDPITGKRNHSQNNWVHSLMADRYPDFNLRQCYFGAHVIKRADREAEANNAERQRLNIKGKFEPVIMLFEGEKAAIIMAIALKWGGAENTFIPLSANGCGGFNPTLEAKRDRWNKLQALKGRKVVLFPDNGKFAEWEAKAKLLKGFCKEVWISTACEPNLHPYAIDYEGTGYGFDDLILQCVKEGKELWDLITTCYGYHGQHRIV